MSANPSPQTDNPMELTYGIDKGAPNGDKTALSIKQGDTVYTFVGGEAEAILALIGDTLERSLGEDEPLSNFDKTYNTGKETRNVLRAEARANFKKILGVKSE